MNLLPEEEQNPTGTFQFAPMMDFLFLMMAIFAILAISRSNIFDTKIALYQRKESAQTANQEKIANISIVVRASGDYAWIAELSEYPLENTKKVQEEIIRRYELGLLPKNKEATKIFLHIDEKANWSNIADILFAVQEIGFSAFPVYKS